MVVYFIDGEVGFKSFYKVFMVICLGLVDFFAVLLGIGYLF